MPGMVAKLFEIPKRTLEYCGAKSMKLKMNPPPQRPEKPTDKIKKAKAAWLLQPT